MTEQDQSEKSIFLAVVEIDSVAERAAFLDRACGGNRSLRAQVEALVQAHEKAQRLLDTPLAGTPWRDETQILESPGTRIGRYKLLQQIGEGGMGVVYMAEQEEPVRRNVALKIIRPGMDSGQVIARFEAERQALAMMDHQNIAKVFDAGTTGGKPGCVSAARPYFVMELVHGVPITTFCDENQLTPRERLALFIPVCQAIQHAHQKGIIHRDIKPSNVLVTLYDDKPVPKVIDFGVAKAIDKRLTEKTLFTQFGVLVGTLQYMSPEQAEMNALGVDTRSDIYSLGVLLYEFLTGTTPLQRERLGEAALDEVLRVIREEEPPRPSVRLSSSNNLPKVAAARKTEPAKLSKLVRGEIDWIVMKCLEKDRSRRYETASGLARDIERYLDDEPVEAGPPSAAYRLRKLARKYWVPVSVVAAFVSLLVAGVVASTWLTVRAKQAENEATRKCQEAEAAQYAADMGNLQAAWDNRNILRVRDLLHATAGFPERGFEWYYWQRMYHVEHLTLAGHRGGVLAVAFAPDGQRLVTRGAEGVVQLWDVVSHRELLTLKSQAQAVCAVAITPDGQLIATGCEDGTVRLYDAASGHELRKLEGHTGMIMAVTVTPDGQWIVTGSSDGTARLWDAASGHGVLTFKGHTGPVFSVAVTADGRRLITGSQDRTARLWDMVSGRELLPLKGHTATVAAVAVTPDGQRIATGSCRWAATTSQRSTSTARKSTRTFERAPWWHWILSVRSTCAKGRTSWSLK
jgi:serine/threonine protein kinase